MDIPLIREYKLELESELLDVDRLPFLSHELYDMSLTLENLANRVVEISGSQEYAVYWHDTFMELAQEAKQLSDNADAIERELKADAIVGRRHNVGIYRGEV